MNIKGRSVRRTVVGDEAILRDLRLQAMSDAPEAFGSTYERELWVVSRTRPLRLVHLLTLIGLGASTPSQGSVLTD